MAKFKKGDRVRDLSLDDVQKVTTLSGEVIYDADVKPDAEAEPARVMPGKASVNQIIELGDSVYRIAEISTDSVIKIEAEDGKIITLNLNQGQQVRENGGLKVLYPRTTNRQWNGGKKPTVKPDAEEVPAPTVADVDTLLNDGYIDKMTAANAKAYINGKVNAVTTQFYQKAFNEYKQYLLNNKPPKPDDLPPAQGGAGVEVEEKPKAAKPIEILTHDDKKKANTLIDGYTWHEDTEGENEGVFYNNGWESDDVDQSQPFAVVYYGDTTGRNLYERAYATNDFSALYNKLKQWDQTNAAWAVLYNPATMQKFGFELFMSNFSAENTMQDIVNMLEPAKFKPMWVGPGKAEVNQVVELAGEVYRVAEIVSDDVVRILSQQGESFVVNLNTAELFTTQKTWTPQPIANDPKTWRKYGKRVVEVSLNYLS